MSDIIRKLRNNILVILHSKNYGIIFHEDAFKSFDRLDLKKDIVLIRVLLNEYYLNLVNLIKCESDINLYVRRGKKFEKIELCSTNEFINFLDLLINNNMLKTDEIKKALKLKELIDYKKYLLSLNNTFNFYFEQESKSVRTKELIKLFTLNNEDFVNKVNKVDSNEFKMMLVKFVNDLNYNKYNFPDNMIRNFEYIKGITKNYEIIDKIKLIRKPKYLNRMKLNKDLENFIMDNIPNYFTKLEKCIYIYIELCNIFTHDENDIYKKNYSINHKDVNRISTINMDNNIIVCYEFVGILCKFLDIIGIDYEIGGDKLYGRGHIYINILYKDLYLRLDSTRGLFDCDMTKTKNNIRIGGIIPIKSNPYTLEEFSDSLEKVYDYLNSINKFDYEYEHELVKEKRSELNIDDIIIFDKKKEIFFDEIKKCDLPIIDKVKYIRLLNKVIFKKEKVVITPLECRMNNKSELIMIMSFIVDNNYEYYLYRYPDTINEISKKTIEDCLYDKTFDFINFLDSKIPGIEYEYKLKCIDNKKLLIRQ